MDDDEELDDELDEELEDEEVDDEESQDSNDDEEDEEDLEAEIEEELNERQKELRQKRIANCQKRLEQAKNRLMKTIWVPFLLPHEKTAYNEAANYPTLKTLRVNVMVEKGKALSRFWSKAMSITAPALPVILIVAVVFIGILAIASIFSSNSSEEAGPQPDTFYGVRAIYTDTNKSNIELIKEYSTVINNGLTSLQGVANYTVTVSVDFAFPDFDSVTLENFVEGKDTEYKEEYELIYELATIAYKSDNEVETAPETLAETLAGIKYFGISSDFTTGFKNAIKNSIGNYIDVKQQGAEENLNNDDEATFITENLPDITPDTARAEKVFIRDYSAPIGEVEKANYIALIFMPKESMTVDALDFTFKDITAEFEVGYVGGGKSATAEYDEDLGKYTCEFTNITFTGATAPDGYFADAKSLLDINNDVELADKSAYITTQDGVITYVKPSSYITFDTTEAFQFTMLME